MASADLALATNASSIIVTDGGDFSYLPDFGEGRCSKGVYAAGGVWLLCTNGVLRLDSSPQLLAPPPGEISDIVASADGGVWAHGYGALYRFQPPGWVTVPTPACNPGDYGFFTALGSREGLYSCTTIATLTAPAVTDVYVVSATGTPAFVTRVDGGIDLLARTGEEVFGNQYNQGNAAVLRFDFDGGLTQVGTPTTRPVRVSSDRQFFLADTSLYRLVQGAWSRTQQFRAEGQSIDLFGAAGVQVANERLTFFNSDGQFSFQRFSVPDVDSVNTPLPMVGPGAAPRFVFWSKVYELDAGALVPVLTLPDVPGSRVAVGLSDGGLAYTAYPATLVRYVGGTFISTPLPTIFALAAVPTPGGTWLVEGDHQVFRVEPDGGVSTLDVVDSGTQTVTLRQVSDTAAVVMSTNRGAAIVDLNTLAAQPFVQPPAHTYDVCTLNGRWFAMTTAGLATSADGGNWQTIGGTGNRIVCWRDKVYVAETGRSWDITTGSWLTRTSPITRGVGLVAQDGRLWISAQGGAVLVHE